MTKLKCGVALGVLLSLSLLGIASAQTGTPPAGATPPPAGASPAGTPPAASPEPAAAPAPAASGGVMLEESAAPAEPPPPLAEPQPPPPVVTAPPPEPVAPPEEEDAPSKAGPFRKGAVRLTLLLGTGYTTDETYLIVGGGLGYFLVDGLGVGLDYEAWIFGSPVMHRVSPEVRYILHFVPTAKPYIGGFYRHTFVNDYDDLNYLGARAGLIIAPERSRVYFGAGAVYEHLLECNDNAFVDCDNVYPEVMVGVSL